MRNNLTKKEVGIVPALALHRRYDYLMTLAETAPVHIITLADAKEMVWIEDEMHKRLIKLIGHDFYPPEQSAKPTMAELTSSIKKEFIKAIPKPIESKVKTEGKFSFNITITSSIGSVVKKENVKVDSKSEAHIKAQNMIKELGLKKATYKIS